MTTNPITADEIEQLHADLTDLKNIDSKNTTEEWGYVLHDGSVATGSWKTPNDAISGMEKRLGGKPPSEWKLAKIAVTRIVLAELVPVCR